jgi:hypothetical protein
MAKQKLTSQEIELIKHWAFQGFTHKFISTQIGCSRVHINRIINKKRWAEVDQPNFARGEELHWRFIQYGKL